MRGLSVALDHEIEAMAARAEREARSKVEQARKLFEKLLWKDRVIRSYRKLFLDADGNLKPEAVDVIADMSAVAAIGVADQAGTSDAVLRDRVGRRTMALHVIARMDLGGAQLSDLAAKLRREPQ